MSLLGLPMEIVFCTFHTIHIQHMHQILLLSSLPLAALSPYHCMWVSPNLYHKIGNAFYSRYIIYCGNCMNFSYQGYLSLKLPFDFAKLVLGYILPLRSSSKGANRWLSSTTQAVCVDSGKNHCLCNASSWKYSTNQLQLSTLLYQSLFSG